jgi:hypothetical protein
VSKSVSMFYLDTFIYIIFCLLLLLFPILFIVTMYIISYITTRCLVRTYLKFGIFWIPCNTCVVYNTTTIVIHYNLIIINKWYVKSSRYYYLRYLERSTIFYWLNVLSGNFYGKYDITSSNITCPISEL